MKVGGIHRMYVGHISHGIEIGLLLHMTIVTKGRSSQATATTPMSEEISANLRRLIEYITPVIMLNVSIRLLVTRQFEMQLKVDSLKQETEGIAKLWASIKGVLT